MKKETWERINTCINMAWAAYGKAKYMEAEKPNEWSDDEIKEVKNDLSQARKNLTEAIKAGMDEIKATGIDEIEALMFLPDGWYQAITACNYPPKYQ